MSKRKKAVIHRLPEIIARDGGEWVCHYCGKKLIPYGTPSNTEPYYVYKIQQALPTQVLHMPTYDDYERYMGMWMGGDIQCWLGYYVMNPEYRRAVADHVIPYAKGGTHDLSNLVASCDNCNARKSTKDYDEFIEYLGQQS